MGRGCHSSNSPRNVKASIYFTLVLLREAVLPSQTICSFLTDLPFKFLVIEHSALHRDEGEGDNPANADALIVFAPSLLSTAAARQADDRES